MLPVKRGILLAILTRAHSTSVLLGQCFVRRIKGFVGTAKPLLFFAVAGSHLAPRKGQPLRAEKYGCSFTLPNGKRLSDAPPKLAKRTAADGVG